ncbi:hypothetical protein VCRA2119O48_860003 [Vibrio crassostreae]|nr:hypothetical protein VCRA2119O48_860003 [Vibrio crassostreae]CAK4028559.1 hypothetical protein VCRA212O16_930003 [Vibrio crassostreae]
MNVVLAEIGEKIVTREDFERILGQVEEGIKKGVIVTPFS